MAKKPNDMNKIEAEIEQTVKREWKIIKKFQKQNEDKLLFAGFIVVLSGIIIINTIYVINRLPAKTPDKGFVQVNANVVLTSQQKADTGAFTVSIKDVTETDKPDPAFTIPENETMLILTISITNNTPGNQDLVPVNQFYVRSRDGDHVAMHPSMYVTQPLSASEIASGQTVSGQISFNVPKNLAHPLLYVDLGWNNYAPVVFDVLK